MSTLYINADLKYIEFLLSVFNSAEDSKNVGDIRSEFQSKFSIDIPNLLNQNFGIIRLIPLLLMREDLKNEKTSYIHYKEISIIRHALAHNNFSANETGYEFHSNIGTCKFSYEEFVPFIHQIENDFYSKP